MTAELRIIVQQRAEDVLQIPVQSVLSLGGQYFTYALTPEGGERRALKVGDSNDEFMEVLDGVREGEKVIMNPRTHFADEIAELEDNIMQDAEAEAKKNPVKRPDVAAPTGPGKSRKGDWKAKAGGGKGRPGGAGKGQPGGAGKGRPGGAGKSAGGGGFDPATIFARMDKNGDGKITADEDTSGRMMAGDADGDGGVTMEEFSNAMKRMMNR